MKKLLYVAILCIVVSLFNIVNVLVNGSGISLILGVAWLTASAYVFVQYRKMNRNEPEEEEQ